MSSSNLLIIIQSQLIISLVVEKSEITKNKECAIAHSCACGVAKRQWRLFSKDRSGKRGPPATSTLYAAVRILSGAFFIY